MGIVEHGGDEYDLDYRFICYYTIERKTERGELIKI